MNTSSKRNKLKNFKRAIASWISNNENAVYFVIMMSVLIVLILMAILNVITLDTILDFGVFFAVVLEGALIALAGAICNYFSNKYEDLIKLETDFDSIVERYEKIEGSYVEDDNTIEGKKELMPVEIIDWLNNKEIKIVDDRSKIYHTPDMVTKYYDKLLSAHESSIVFNNTAIRVERWEKKDTEFILYTGRTTYFDTLVTNRAMDYEFESKLSVRNLYEPGPYINALADSQLSNHLGFNGFIESSDGKIIIGRRKNDLSVGKKSWSGSISGSLKAKYAIDDKNSVTLATLYQGIVNEIRDELGIVDSGLVGSNIFEKIQLIAAYRDLIEGGKPHFLFYAKSTLSFDEIKTNFKAKKKKDNDSAKSENSERRRKEIIDDTDADNIKCIPVDSFKSELKVYLDRICEGKNTYTSNPSYAACFVMFRDYIKKTCNE